MINQLQDRCRIVLYMVQIIYRKSENQCFVEIYNLLPAPHPRANCTHFAQLYICSMITLGQGEPHFCVAGIKTASKTCWEQTCVQKNIFCLLSLLLALFSVTYLHQFTHTGETFSLGKIYTSDFF